MQAADQYDTQHDSSNEDGAHYLAAATQAATNPKSDIEQRYQSSTTALAAAVPPQTDLSKPTPRRRQDCVDKGLKQYLMTMVQEVLARSYVQANKLPLLSENSAAKQQVTNKEFPSSLPDDHWKFGI